MSGPYDSYGGGGGYGGYQQQGNYGQQQQQYGQGYPPQQGYGQQQGYPPQQGSYGGYDQNQNQNFGPPRRQDSFGPPQHGGFQHAQSGYNNGSYYGSNPQGSQTNDAYAANQAWMNNNEGTLHQQGQGQNQGTQQYPQTARQSSDPNAPNYDPNAPPMTESDRGLLGALGGGAAGAWGGHKAGHGFLGAIGGAIMGSLAEDYGKKKKNQHSSGGSSWGGSSWGGR